MWSYNKTPKSKAEMYRVEWTNNDGKKCWAPYVALYMAHAFAARKAKEIVGKACVYENLGDGKYELLCTYESETLPKNFTAPVERHVQKVQDMARGMTHDARWKDAARRVEVKAIHRCR